MSRVGQTSCILAALFASSAAAAADRDSPEILHQACSDYDPSRHLEVVVEIHDASPLFDPKIIYRSPPSDEWRSLPLVPDADGVVHRATIPRRRLRGQLHYFIESFDTFGNGPARLGSAQDPLRLRRRPGAKVCAQIRAQRAPPEPVPPSDASRVGPTDPTPPQVEQSSCDEEDRPIYCEPWAWGIAGGVVVVGGLIAIIAVAASSGDAPPNTAGVRVTAPAPASLRFTW